MSFFFVFFNRYINYCCINYKIPKSQSNRTSVRYAGQRSLIHGVPTSQLKGLKGSVANLLVPDTNAHLQGVQWSPCGPTQYQAVGDNVMLDWCMIWWEWTTSKVQEQNIREEDWSEGILRPTYFPMQTSPVVGNSNF